MSRSKALLQHIQNNYAKAITATELSNFEVTVECTPQQLIAFCKSCKEDDVLEFDMLIDVCGVDYLQYGESEWDTHDTTRTGFCRGVNRDREFDKSKHRFAVVYHLLSTTNNQRLRIKVFLNENDLSIPSVIDLWPSANWFEREAFDLFGIIFTGHPDLRRILTDYGFNGHPFRKDFPLSGEVEVRYDAKLGRVVYEPVDIEPRVLVPKVIRSDNRYLEEGE